MSGSDDDSEKQFQATQKKLDDARKRGEIAKSTDLNTAASYFGILLVAMTMGSDSLKSIGATLAGMVEQSDFLSRSFFQDSAKPISGDISQHLLQGLTPWFAIPAALVLLTIIAQRSFVVAPEKLAFKLSRISPLSNAKNKFGRAGLFEFAKSFAKLLIYSIALTVFLKGKIPEILNTIQLNGPMVSVVLLSLIIEFLSIVLLIALSIGAVDFLWQQKEHQRKNMMSRKEMTDESKQSEGDPHTKQQRRQKGYEIAMNQMLAEVPTADVIVVNPTHYAVALKWDRAVGGAPACIAKGVDEIAARIREVAAEAGVPIHRDPPTARALFATVELGQEIQSEHYQAVAAAIRFAEALREKTKTVIQSNNE